MTQEEKDQYLETTTDEGNKRYFFKGSARYNSNTDTDLTFALRTRILSVQKDNTQCTLQR